MVEVVVPWRGGCPHREAALAWSLQHYEHRGWKVTVAEAPAGPWCKAAAVMPAIAASPAETIVVADGDVWTPNLHRAVKAVEDGAPWAIPHIEVHRLTEDASADVMAGRATIAPGLPTSERPYRGVEGGGIVVLPRATALDIPLDPRFVGWGQEDTSWASALTTLVGAPWRAAEWLFHLWHPPQERMSRRYGSVEGRELHRRYVAAAENPAAMRDLIEEAKCSAIS